MTSITHGLRINEPVTGARAINPIATGVIGLVATAADADVTTFPLNQAVLVTDIRSAIGNAGQSGTLAAALSSIADQCSPIVVVVRVAPGVATQGVTVQQATDINVIGSTDNGVYTGMQALLSAEAKLGVRPRILGTPGLDSSPVVNAMTVIAKRLRGMVYARASVSSVADAVTTAGQFSARELMLIYPDWSSWAGSGVAVALGTRAAIDQAIGWHKTISNYPVNNVLGMSKDVGFDLLDSQNDAGLLNSANVTTMIRMNGFRYWGNRTCSAEPKFAFESATRTAQVLQDTIAQNIADWTVDQPMTVGLIRDIEASINAEFRSLKSQGRIIDGSCWYDPSENSSTDLAGGKLVLDYDYTPCAPAEGITFNQRITDKYYEGFGDQLSATSSS